MTVIRQGDQTRSNQLSLALSQEKETIAKCIADLKLLSKKAQAQPVM